MMAAGTVIVGAGQAGFQAAASLREHGYQEAIVLVGDEGVAPYQRPPLSKAYLLGEMSGERLLLRPLSYYEKHAIELVLGDRVTVLEALPRVMSRAVTVPVSDFYAQAHRGWGSELLLEARLARIDGAGGRVTGLTLADGRRHAADLVLAGIGIVPNVELAQATGLAVANGIVVDRRLATADPRISAIGDCAAFPDPASGAMIRLESVQ